MASVTYAESHYFMFDQHVHSLTWKHELGMRAAIKVDLYHDVCDNLIN